MNHQTMPCSFARPRAFFPLAFLAAALAASACQDESPTLSDDELFPGGVPVTLEVIVPAAEFLDVLGVHTGFASRNDFAFQLVANQYGGSLSARTLLRFAIPDSVTFSQDGTTRVRPFTIRSARLVILADSAASAPASGSTLQLFELAQPFDLATVSWTLAADTAPAPVPWTQPGGTRGPLLDQFAYVPGAAGDSVTFQLDSLEAARVRAKGHPGLLVAAGTPGTRVQLTTAALILRAHPDSAARDTTIESDLSNAAPFLAAALVAGGTVTIDGWPDRTTQVGAQLEQLLPRFGAAVRREGDALTVDGGVGVRGGAALPGVELDLSEAGELAPTLAALAALASAASRLTGIGHLRGHETDRLAALRDDIVRLGGSVTELDGPDGDGLAIEPAPLHGGPWLAYDDHRMATSGALLGLAVEGIEVDDIGSTAKTLPEFPELWEELTTAGS